MAPPSAILTDEAALAQYFVTHDIPWTAQPGVTVASIIVSILGSYATLMILGKRSSNHGVWNRMLLLMAALTFAVVAVWSMHFVSMLGVRLVPSPHFSWFISFSPGFTVLSLFVPLLVSLLAFIFLGSQVEFMLWRAALSGVFVGGTISLMHYSASFSLPAYHVHYRSWTIVLAILEACAAATVSFVVFFKLRSMWQDSFWKRAGSACILATAVCGMHYIGLAGTKWTFRPSASVGTLNSAASQSTRLTIAVSVMCIGILLISLGLTIYDYKARRKQTQDARQIVIASAAFDKMGRVLVKLDGSLPLQVVETDAVLKDIIHELSPNRKTFQWLFCLSFNWTILTPYIPLISSSIAHRRANPPELPKKTQGFYGRNGSRAAAARAASKQARELNLFKTRFVEAALDLSGDLNVELKDVGVLFDKVLVTGGVGRPAVHPPKSGRAPGERLSTSEKDLEANPSMQEPADTSVTPIGGNTEGLMLVVVRDLVDNAQAEHYLSHGYRLADVKLFSNAFSSRVGVPRIEMESFLGECKTFARRGTRPVVQPAGAYVGLYGIRPTAEVEDGKKGIEVLTYGFARHQVPAYRLPDVICPFIPEARSWLRSIAGLTMSEVLAALDEEISRPSEPRRRYRSSTSTTRSNKWSDDDPEYEEDEDEETSPLVEFQIALSIAIEALGEAMSVPWPNINDIARLSPEILTIPSSVDVGSAEPAQMIVLEVILPSPASFLGSQSGPRPGTPPAPFTFTPFSLFSSVQTMMIRGRGAKDFAQEVIEQLNRDFGTPPAIPVLTHSHTTSVDTATVQLLSHTSTPFRPFTDAANPGSPFGPPHLSGHQLPCSPDGPLRKQEGEVETKGVWDGQRSNQMLSSRIGGRVVWGGSDGWHLRSMRDLELSPNGNQLAGAQW